MVNESVIPREGSVRGVSGAMVKYQSNGFSVPAWLEVPKGFKNGPGILLVQEAYGLEQHVKDQAANLAAEGYAVLVPDYYAHTA